MPYSVSQQKGRGFDFYQVIYFTFFATTMGLASSWGNQTAKFYLFFKLVKKNKTSESFFRLLIQIKLMQY